MARTFKDGLVDQQGIDIAELFARILAAPHSPALQVVVLRLCGILPPSIDAIGLQQFFGEVLPVGSGGIGVEEVNPVGTGNVVASFLHRLSHLRTLVYLGPHREHEPHVHLVQVLDELARVGIVVFVELHGIPAILAPPLPVLHDEVEGYLFGAETLGCLHDFVGGVEPLAAMDIAKCPLGHHGCRTCHLAISTDDFIGRTDEHGVIDSMSHGRAQHSLVGHWLVVEDGLVATLQFSLDGMSAGSETAEDGHRGGKPHVAVVDKGLTIDAEIVATCHRLPHIEQKRVGAIGRHGEGAFEEVAHTHLVLAASGGGDVHHFLHSLPFLLGECHMLVSRVKLGHAVVVPQHSIALVRQEHGNGYLCVHLCETARETTHIGVAILKLPQTKEAFIGWRVHLQCGHVGGFA